MEQWDIYTKDRVKTGETILRGSFLQEGIYHLVVHVCIFNAKGCMLIQQRQPFKEGWPNLWDFTVGGSAVAGESSQMAAEREVLEEIGYKIDLSNIRPQITIGFEHGFDDYYLIEKDVDVNQLTLQYEEVQAVKWASLDEIMLLLNNGEFIPYSKHFVAMLFEMKGRYGTHTK